MDTLWQFPGDRLRLPIGSRLDLAVQVVFFLTGVWSQLVQCRGQRATRCYLAPANGACALNNFKVPFLKHLDWKHTLTDCTELAVSSVQHSHRGNITAQTIKQDNCKEESDYINAYYSLMLDHNIMTCALGLWWSCWFWFILMLAIWLSNYMVDPLSFCSSCG